MSSVLHWYSVDSEQMVSYENVLFPLSNFNGAACIMGTLVGEERNRWSTLGPLFSIVTLQLPGILFFP